MEKARKDEVKFFRNGAESLILEFLKGKDIEWCRSAIWIILIKPCKESILKDAKAIKWLEKVMKESKFETVEELILIVEAFTNLIDKEAETE